MSRTRALPLLALLLSAGTIAEEPLTIAVASNFSATAKELVTEFSRTTGLSARISSGSTGKLYAQIVNGAPYDVFLAADEQRPAMLEGSGAALRGSRVVYAVGALVLWSSSVELEGEDCHAALQRGDYKKLAIANPATAPYGRAAKEFLQAVGLWTDAGKRLVVGENVSQTLQFVESGNATLGFAALAQFRKLPKTSVACSWRLPVSGNHGIRQAAVILDGARRPNAARAFMAFLRGPLATSIIASHGYTVPPNRQGGFE